MKPTTERSKYHFKFCFVEKPHILMYSKYNNNNTPLLTVHLKNQTLSLTKYIKYIIHSHAKKQI